MAKPTTPATIAMRPIRHRCRGTCWSTASLAAKNSMRTTLSYCATISTASTSSCLPDGISAASCGNRCQRRGRQPAAGRVWRQDRIRATCFAPGDWPRPCCLHSAPRRLPPRRSITSSSASERNRSPAAVHCRVPGDRPRHRRRPGSRGGHLSPCDREQGPTAPPPFSCSPLNSSVWRCSRTATRTSRPSTTEPVLSTCEFLLPPSPSSTTSSD